MKALRAQLIFSLRPGSGREGLTSIPPEIIRVLGVLMIPGGVQNNQFA